MFLSQTRRAITRPELTRFRKEDHQAVREVDYVRLGKKADAPEGRDVIDSYRVQMSELIEPPSPGVKFQV